MISADITLAQILGLSKSERIHVVQYILDSLQHEEGTPISPAWKSELQMRRSLFLAEQTPVYTWDEIEKGLKHEE